VYCASSSGRDPSLADHAATLGTALAKAGIEVVYGGGAVGLMGTVADAAMEAGGRVTGVIPSALMPREVAHRGITTLVEVATMHERKAEMFDRSDAFVALPGGFGTLEEVLEVLTWAQLGIHDKPISLLNVDRFYDRLLRFLDDCVDAGVLKQKNREMLLVADSVSELLDVLGRERPPVEPKWDQAFEAG
jgi:uncharacterized protein (TIGR00730 family)